MKYVHVQNWLISEHLVSLSLCVSSYLSSRSSTYSLSCSLIPPPLFPYEDPAASSLAFLAFTPLSFGAGLSFFSLWLALTALALATAGARKSERYPFFAVELTTFLYSFLLGVEAEKEEVVVERAGWWVREAILVFISTLSVAKG